METRRDFLKVYHPFSVRQLTVLSILVSLSSVGRIFFQFIPNVQPMTAIFIIITFVYGLREGLIVSLLSVTLSNFILGMGPWIFAQIISYAIVMIIAAILVRPLYQRKRTKWIIIFFLFLTGILYGVIISYLTYKMFGMSRFLPYYLMGITFDILHGFGNAGFYIILEPLLKPLLKKAIMN